MDRDKNTEEKLESVKRNLSEYARRNVQAVLKEMLHRLFLATPEDPIEFMIDFLNEYKEARDSGKDADSGSTAAAENDGPVPNHLNPMPVINATESKYNRSRRRVGVSAEPMNVLDSEVEDVVIPKSDQECELIRSAVSKNILFQSLDQDEMQIVVNAMEPIRFTNGTVIIKQGDDGDKFYVVKSGTCDTFVQHEDDDEPALVHTYGHGEAFGELALMYNCPRAATVMAKGDVEVWAMGRQTFRKMLMNATSEKRKRYEQFLAGVPLLESLKPYERSKVADALEDVEFQDGECIIAEGDVGRSMYFVKEGQAAASKQIGGRAGRQIVMNYSAGDYFGELALLNDKPRAASVFAVGKCTCAVLDRDSFTRLLGPCESLLKRNVGDYERMEAKLQESKEATSAPPPKYKRGRRAAVSAEPVSQMNDTEWKRVVVPKTKQQEQAIRDALSGNFLFASLDEDEMQTVVDAMFEKAFKAGDKIIKQGDDGDHFYVLGEGTADCFVNGVGKVASYTRGQSFGELALMYNTPRAASIVATSDVRVYGLDRVTFHRVLMETTQRKRKLYEGFLEKVPILESLVPYERHSLADALVPQTFKDGEYIIRRGDKGNNMYFIEQGSAVATKPLTDGAADSEVYQYKAGDFFGELALLLDQPRAANVIAKGPTKVLRVDRDTFTRLLGSCDDIVKRNQANYQRIEARLQQNMQA